uniref:DCD domain-containing protein n=1 Tax=Salix viminalis TaxID=40686 RepID=A0A6N2MKN7_SALVM
MENTLYYNQEYYSSVIMVWSTRFKFTCGCNVNHCVKNSLNRLSQITTTIIINSGLSLTNVQTSKLMSLSASLAVSPGTSVLTQKIEKWGNISQPGPLPKSRVQGEGDNLPASEIDYTDNSSTKSDSTHLASSDVDNQRGKDQLDMTAVDQEEKELIFKKLQELALRSEPQASSLRDGTEDSPPMHDMHLEEKASAEEQMGSEEKNDDNPGTFCQSTISQLVQGMEELKAFRTEQTLKMGLLEQKLVEAEEQIQQLKDRCMMLESMSTPSKEHSTPSKEHNDETVNNLFEEEQLDPSDAIHLMGGYDGESWLSTFSLYFPSQDAMKSLRPMSSVRSYASVVQFHEELYVFGGGNGQLWYDTVESYNPANDQWTPRPSLTKKKGSLAGATLNEKIFAIGGGNGVECFADVEMLVIDIGKWIPTRSMLQKRFALAAVELNGVVYATGGFDGSDYSKTAERFDPREHSWSRIASMNAKRGCHSLVVLNEKIYALGGYDGSTMVSSTEIFDPRLDSWIIGEPMNKPRGYAAAAAVKESIYVIGGLESDENIIDTVEHFKQGQGWQEKNSRVIKKRCFLSAIAL